MKYYLTYLLLASIILVVMSANIANADSSQGFTVTSVSLTNILHPGQPASQTQWLITTSLNGGGQSLVGTLGNSTVKYQGLTSAYPLQLSGSTDPETAFYIINNQQPNGVYTYTTIVENGTISNIGLSTTTYAAPPCPSGTHWEEDFNIQNLLLGTTQGNPIPVSRVCIVPQEIATEAPISSTPNIQFSSHFTLSANGRQERLDLSYSNQSATSPDGLVQANWVGSLVTGSAAPDGSQYIAISNLQSNTWTVQTTTSWNNWNNDNSRLSFTSVTPSSIPSSCSPGSAYHTAWAVNVANCLNYLIQNQQLNQVNGEASGLLNNVQISNLPTTFVSHQGQQTFSVPLNNYFVTNPVVTLRINGSFIGVVIPQGVPKILSATSQPFNSGNNGTIIVQVQNIGNAQGAFYFSLSSCSGISTISSSKYAVAQGSTQEIGIPIFTSGINQTINEQCTVTITDYNGGGSNSTLVNVIAKPSNQCTPNSQVIQGSSVCACVNTNGVYKPGQCQTCPYGVVSSNGQYVCATPPSTIPSNSSSGLNLNINQTAGALFQLEGNLTTVVGAAQMGYSLLSTTSLPPLAVAQGACQIASMLNVHSSVVSGACSIVSNISSITSVLGGLGIKV